MYFSHKSSIKAFSLGFIMKCYTIVINDKLSPVVYEKTLLNTKQEDILLKEHQFEKKGKKYICKAYQCFMTEHQIKSRMVQNKPILRCTVFSGTDALFSIWYHLLGKEYSFDLYRKKEQTLLFPMCSIAMKREEALEIMIQCVINRLVL